MNSSKRIFDLILATIGTIVSFPLFMLIAIAIKVYDAGPVLFMQVRVGRNGRKFKLIKFRTMIMDAEKKGNQLTVGDDPRITRVGRVIRKFKLDELPQLINVLKGEMSFVGPRPEVKKYVELYTQEQREVLKLYPGITDPASIKYINESEILAKVEDPEKFYIENIMPEKIEINLDYAKRATRWTDFIIIIKTLPRIIL
ncbi:MAG TPA: sugar transferase [Candidatus Aminicenantes bacterium]|nr:sugar transferase [Candidatus Aminicenantes bacterium]